MENRSRGFTVSMVLAVTVLLSTLTSLTAAPSASEQKRIDALIAAVEKSGLIFIRNGVDHTAVDAAAHMRLKLSNAGNRVNTAEQFIDYLASKSSITGEPYYLKYPDGHKETAAAWLQRKLKEMGGR